jgi:hypothetical protein
MKLFDRQTAKTTQKGVVIRIKLEQFQKVFSDVVPQLKLKDRPRSAILLFDLSLNIGHYFLELL